MLWTIPVGTAFPEELAFRGVLLALLLRLTTRRGAVLTSSVLFGLWHVLPALGGSKANQVVEDALGSGTAADVARVVGTVLLTALAGVAFAEARLRTCSLLTAALGHWAANGIGVGAGSLL